LKRKRHALILELIQQYEITTQDELLAKLRENGFEVTQATVSRDIKELRLVKAMSPSGQYRYMAGAAQGDEYLAKFYTIFSGSVISVDYAGNTCVVKCYAGMAQAACAAIDAMHFEGIVGTLAGDDTIFVLCRTPELTQQLKSSLDKMLQNG
jgi:transcriptional regulator of arginine metabolism